MAKKRSADREILEMLVLKAIQQKQDPGTLEDEIASHIKKAKVEDVTPVQTVRVIEKAEPALYLPRVREKMKEFFNYLARLQQEAVPYQGIPETVARPGEQDIYDLIPEQMKTDKDSMSYRTAERVIKYTMMETQLQNAGSSAEFVTTEDKEKFELFRKLSFGYNIWRYSLPIGS